MALTRYYTAIASMTATGAAYGSTTAAWARWKTTRSPRTAFPVEIRTGGNPTLHRNRINDNRGIAVFVHERGRGVFEADNDLTGNAMGAWNIAKDCEENVKRPKT
jgi:hypothetical protein